MSSAIDNTTKRGALLVTCLAGFLTPFAVSSINIALPSIGNEFAMNAILLSWVPTSYILAASTFLVPVGRIADIFGRKRIFTYGVVLFTIVSVLLALAPSASLLIAFRVLQGIGGSMIFGTSVAILTSVFPMQERGRVLGINAAFIYLGLSLGPFLGGILTGYFGWRSIFIFNIPVGSLILLGLSKLQGEWADARGQKFDFVGAVIYSFMLIAVMYGISILTTTPGIGLMIAGGLGIFFFMKWETRVASPMLDISLFRGNTVFVMSNLAALISYSATFAVGFLLSLYLQYIKGLSPQSAGLILVSQPIMQAVFSPFAGKLSDRIEPRVVASIGMAFCCVGLLLLISLNENTAIGWIILWLALLGFGFALFMAPNTNAIMSSVEKRFYGVSSAMLSTMRLGGQMFSMGITMLIFTIYIGQVEIVPAYYPLFLTSARIAFLIFTILCFGGIFASLARGKLR